MIFVRTKRAWVAAAALVVASAVGTQASAEVICATARKTTWNVPNGGLVINRSGGMVRVILDAVNEWGTHSVLSHGTDFWVTQATAKQPATQDSCSVPIKKADLTNAGPGVSAVSLPALYVYYFANGLWSSGIGTRASGSTAKVNGVEGMEWYSGNSPAGDWGYFEGRANPWTWYPASSNRGRKVADFMWTWPLWGSFATGGDLVYRYQADDGVFMRYGFNRFLDMRNLYKGDANGNIGQVCSTLPAWASWRAEQGGVRVHTPYSHTDKVRAIDALRGAVKYECDSGFVNAVVGFNYNGILSRAYCEVHDFINGGDMCTRAANQVTNAFAVDTADTTSTGWSGVRSNTAIKPKSISPDCLAGRNTNHCYPVYGPSSPAGATEWGSSPWAWDAPRKVTWSGSTAYSCWSN